MRKIVMMIVVGLIAVGVTACTSSKELDTGDATRNIETTETMDATGSTEAKESTEATEATNGTNGTGTNNGTEETDGTGSVDATGDVGGAADLSQIKLERAFEKFTFDNPVGLEHREGYANMVYIIEQTGRIVSMNVKLPDEEPAIVLDIKDRVHDGGEQGLLGVAFHPKKPNEVYVNYTTKSETIIARYDADPANPEMLDPKSEQILLTFKQPYSNHNGGQLAFGPDGYLYIATGDGGSGGDPHNNGQSLDTLLGKILRIDVNVKMEKRAYAIPSDNPFIDKGEPEIYAYGLRNPWRFSFDQETGKLWAADVGQDQLEEINHIELGKNYGWRIQEGTECYNPKSNCDASELEQPIYTYGRELGVSITGGYVYRGEQIPELKGWYVYSDYGMGTLWALREQEDGSFLNKSILESGQNITSFGRDSRGELYVCTQEGFILRLR
jgi:glucose/arabinose dehydrogenase